MLDTVVMSGDDVCCSVVFGTLVGVFVFSVMWSELLSKQNHLIYQKSWIVQHFVTHLFVLFKYICYFNMLVVV